MKYSVFAPDDVGSVEADLGRLWRENLPITVEEMRARVRWYYEENPVGKGSVQLLRAEGDDSTIVGCAGVGPRRFLVAGEVKRAALLADFAVSKEHRTLQPAILLQRAMMDHCKKSYAFVYGFPNHRAEGVVKRVGYATLGHMARYACVLRYATYLRTLVTTPLLAHSLSLGADMTLQAVRAVNMLAFRKKLEMVEEDTLDEGFDALWERGQSQYGICCVRSREFLDWRFHSGPQPERWLFGLRDRDNHTLHGYVFVKPEGRVAHFNDFFADSDEHLEQLLVSALAEMYRRQMHSATLRFLGPARIRSMLSRIGFSRRSDARLVNVDVGDADHGMRAFVTNQEHWFITDGDEDA